MLKSVVNMFKKEEKKLRGMALIDEVSGRFTAMINELDEGIGDCRNEQSSIITQIESLTNRKNVLHLSIDRACSMAKNLKKLIGE